MPERISIDVFFCRNHSNGLWPRIEDILSARRCQAEVNHVTGDVHYLTFLLDSKRTVLTIHDLAQLSRLRGLRRWLYWLFWFWLPVRRAAAVTVVSEETKRQLLSYVRCDPRKVHVVHNHISPEFRPIPHSFDTKKPRILQIGTSWNKNVERVAEAVTGMPCKLVVIGPLSVAQVQLFERLKIDYENHIELSHYEVIAQYGRCDVVTFVSLAEGFGLPILEANAIGRPVVTSNLSSMPEVAGQAACLVDPYNVLDIRNGICRVIDDEFYREELIANGFENVNRFRRETTAKSYAKIYENLHSQRGAGLEAPAA